MFALIQKLFDDESGQGLPEYAMLVGVVVTVMVAIAVVWNTGITAAVNTVITRIQTAITG